MKLITDLRRGSIVTATAVDMWELVELKPVGDGFSVVAFELNLRLFGVQAAVIETVRASTAACPPQ